MFGSACTTRRGSMRKYHKVPFYLLMMLDKCVVYNVNFSVYRTLLTNGSLYISQVQHREDKGSYQCQAKISSLGTIVSRAAQLQIACKSLSLVSFCLQKISNLQIIGLLHEKNWWWYLMYNKSINWCYLPAYFMNDCLAIGSNPVAWPRSLAS